MLSNQVRIIGGKWRGRKIYFPEDESKLLRPTPDRIRETLFNWLTPFIADTTCLDAFAGSGILGIEALSRGAKFISFVESNSIFLTAIKKNISHLESESKVNFNLGVIPQCSLSVKKTFDIVFLDPPFKHGLIEITLNWLNTQHYINENSFIYIEAEKELLINLPDGWKWFRHKTTSTLQYGLLSYSKK